MRRQGQQGRKGRQRNSGIIFFSLLSLLSLYFFLRRQGQQGRKGRQRNSSIIFFSLLSLLSLLSLYFFETTGTTGTKGTTTKLEYHLFLSAVFVVFVVSALYLLLITHYELGAAYDPLSHSKKHQFVVRRGEIQRSANFGAMGCTMAYCPLLQQFVSGSRLPLITTNLVHLKNSKEGRLWHLNRTNLTHTLLTRLLLLQELTLT